MMDQAMRTFLAACGLDGPLMIGVEEPGRSAISWQLFDQPFLVIGRNTAADLRLNHPDVSSRHAYVQLVAGRLFVVDLQSRTGTHWIDEPGVWGWMPPDPGIKIGPYRLRPRSVDLGSPERSLIDGTLPPDPVSRTFEQDRLPSVALEFVASSSERKTWQVSRSLVLIGSSQSCRLRLQGERVAPIHASMLRTASGCYLVDLLGKGGTRVNGERVRSIRLHHNDQITIDKYQIRVQMSHEMINSPGQPRAIESRDLASRQQILGPIVSTEAMSSLPGLTGNSIAAMIQTMFVDFSLNQAQASERFQQSVLGALQSFAAVHSDQMISIREELDQIRRLTQEQQSLQGKIEDKQSSAYRPPALRLISGELAADSPDWRPARPVPAPPQLTLKPAEIQFRMPPPTQASSNQAAGSDLHGQIINRLAEINEERQGRWQKLLKNLFD